ncbi:MAG: glycine zipper 2TM domain-containing protein [Rhodanobacteraceae bacterium]
MSRQPLFQSGAAVRAIAMLICILAAGVLLAGCGPTYKTRPGYYGRQPAGGGDFGGGRNCYQGCGVVQKIREVQLGNDNGHAALGTVIGAVVGGLLGNQVGGGRGKTAATVAGAVGGGFAGHAVGERTGNGNTGWQVVVRLNNGQYATVTQRDPPQVRVGDQVMIRGDQVYRY